MATRPKREIISSQRGGNTSLWREEGREANNAIEEERRARERLEECLLD